MRRQRILFPQHFLDGRIHFAHRTAECGEGILQAIRAHRPYSGAKGQVSSAVTSIIANAGVPVEVRQKFTGHASAEMNARYTHHELSLIHISEPTRLLSIS